MNDTFIFVVGKIKGKTRIVTKAQSATPAGRRETGAVA